MNSPIKFILIVAGAWLVIDYMRGGGGGDLPRSLLGQVAQAKSLDRKLVILMTGSDWCPPCMTLEREVISSAEWTAFAGNEIIFQKFDYPNGGEALTPAHGDLTKLPGFQGFPTMLVVNGEGKILDRRIGKNGGTSDYIQWIRGL